MSAPPQAPLEAQRAARYEALLRLLQLLITQRDPTALFRTLASELRHVVSFDGISLVVYDEAVRTVRFSMLEIVNPSEEVPPSEVPLAGAAADRGLTPWGGVPDGQAHAARPARPR